MKRHQQKRMARLKQRQRRYRVRLLGHHRRWEALAAWFDPLVDPSRLAFAEGHFPAKGLRTQLYVVCAMEQLFNRDLVRAFRGYSDAFKAALYTFDQPLFPGMAEAAQANISDQSFEVPAAMTTMQDVHDAIGSLQRSNRPASPDGYYTARVHRSRLADIIPAQVWLERGGAPPAPEAHDWPWTGVLEFSFGPVYVYAVQE